MQPVFANGARERSWGLLARPWPQGDAVYPVLKPLARMLEDLTATRSDVPETDSTFNADLLEPERIQASSVYRRVDAARFPNMDSALRIGT